MHGRRIPSIHFSTSITKTVTLGPSSVSQNNIETKKEPEEKEPNILFWASHVHTQTHMLLNNFIILLKSICCLFLEKF